MCYTIVCIVLWCPAVYKTSTTSIQSIGFTVTGICFSELLISFAYDLELLRATKLAWDFLGVNFWSRDVFGFAGSPRDFFGSRLLAPFNHPRHLKSSFGFDRLPQAFTTVFLDMRLLKTKIPAETFPKFPSIIHVIDRSDQNSPITVRLA